MFDRITSIRGLIVIVIVGVFLVAGMIWWTHLDVKHFIDEIGPPPKTKGDDHTPINLKAQETIKYPQQTDVKQVGDIVEKQANGTGKTEMSVTSSNNETLAQKDKREKTAIKRRGLPNVSPHGFGPYPEVPQEYMKTKGVPSWMETKLFGFPPASRNQELMSRVLLKLWKEGNTTVGGAMMRPNGRMLINYKNRAYVRYATRKTPDGGTKRYIASWTSGSVETPSSEQLLDGYVPPGVEIIDLDKEDPTLDPYEFLGLE